MKLKHYTCEFTTGTTATTGTPLIALVGMVVHMVGHTQELGAQDILWGHT